MYLSISTYTMDKQKLQFMPLIFIAAKKIPLSEPLSPSEGESSRDEAEALTQSVETETETEFAGPDRNMYWSSDSTTGENEDTALDRTVTDTPPNLPKRKLDTNEKNSSGNGHRKHPIWAKFEEESVGGQTRYKCKTCKIGNLTGTAQRLRRHYEACPALNSKFAAILISVHISSRNFS
jgi:hypothetical protein